MPIAGAVAINFSAPLFATLFAALWLKETIGLARGAALIVGFLGVLLVASPGADTFRTGALFAVANAVLYGSVTAAVRGMSATESAETLTMYQMLFMTFVFSAGTAGVRLCHAGTDGRRCHDRRRHLQRIRAISGGRGRSRLRRHRRWGRSIIFRWSGR